MKFTLPNAKEFSRHVATEEQLLYIQYLLELKLKSYYELNSNFTIMHTSSGYDGSNDYVTEVLLPHSDRIQGVDIESYKISYLYNEKNNFNNSLKSDFIYVVPLVEKLNNDLSKLGYVATWKDTSVYNLGQIVLSW